MYVLPAEVRLPVYMPRGWPVALNILDPGTRTGWLVNAAPWPPYSWEETQGGWVGFEVGLNVLAGQFVRICYLQHLLSSYTQFFLCLGHMLLVYFVRCLNLKKRTLSFPVLIDPYLVQRHTRR